MSFWAASRTSETSSVPSRRPLAVPPIDFFYYYYLIVESRLHFINFFFTLKAFFSFCQNNKASCVVEAERTWEVIELIALGRCVQKKKKGKKDWCQCFAACWCLWGCWSFFFFFFLQRPAGTKPNSPISGQVRESGWKKAPGAFVLPPSSGCSGRPWSPVPGHASQQVLQGCVTWCRERRRAGRPLLPAAAVCESSQRSTNPVGQNTFPAVPVLCLRLCVSSPFRGNLTCFWSTTGW